ncbi:hypothetical protein JT359_20100 [Candidatus Poribacteria bacterium]|nr:hypothetical protein [Candidatus Poribacteria bacterium]
MALPARDMNCWLPLGRDNEQLLSLYVYTLAYTQKVFPWFSVYDIQLYLSVVCFTLTIGVLLATLPVASVGVPSVTVTATHGAI